MRHSKNDLKQMQSLPLAAKIIMTKQRIRAWYENYDGNVYVSFSGGKDSTVLKHIVDSIYDDVPAVFINTGLEYPGIQRFVKDIKNGKYDCFNSNVEIIRPEMRFDQVIKKYGYPVISKEVAKMIKEGKTARKKGNNDYYAIQKLEGRLIDKYGNKSMFNCEKWGFMLDAPFKVSHQCCDVMKKRPFAKYEKETFRKPYIGTMTSESRQRYAQWLRYGCNAFDKNHPNSAPLSFWTDQDVLQYIKKFNVPYAPVYGDIVETDKQIGLFENVSELTTTGCQRTGCMFCMFGAHTKEDRRFLMLKETHPNQYNYCINGGHYNDETGEWEPDKNGLGIGRVLDYIGASDKY